LRFLFDFKKIDVCRQKFVQIVNMKCEEICQVAVAVTHADEQTLRRI